MKQKISILLLLIISAPGLCSAFTGGVVYDPSNYAQNALSAKNSIKLLIHQAKMLEFQAQTLSLSVANSRGLVEHSWQNMASLLQHAARLTEEGQAISYTMADLDKAFNQYYPNAAKDGVQKDYQRAYKDWNKTTMDTLQSSLQSMGLMANQLGNEEQVINALKRKSQGGKGQLEALQVLQEINVQNVNQLQSLKQMVATQSNVQSAYMAKQVSQDAYEDEMVAQLIGSMPTEFPAYKENPKLGFFPNF